MQRFLPVRTNDLGMLAEHCHPYIEVFQKAAPLLIAAVPSPRFAPARGPPLWEAAAAAAEQVENDSQWNSSAQPASGIEFDQRIAWWVRAGAKTDETGSATARQG